MWLLNFFNIGGVIEQVLRIIGSLLESSGPILKGIASGLVWLVQALWEGFKDIIDNVYTIITVLVLCLASWSYAAVPAKVQVSKCEKQIQIQKVYIQKQCPKTKPQPKQEKFWPWED